MFGFLDMLKTWLDMNYQTSLVYCVYAMCKALLHKNPRLVKVGAYWTQDLSCFFIVEKCSW